MIKSSRSSDSMWRPLGRAFLSGLAAFVLLAAPVASIAQSTTSAIRGTILEPDGQPAAGVSIQVTDSRTGRVVTTSTSSSGRFAVSQLNVGGPYTVDISSPNHADQSVTDIMVDLGDAFEFAVTLTAESIEEIVVTASAVQTVPVALGPSSTFNFDDLQNLPAINRDITEIVRIDPRIYVDEAGVNEVQCLGANPRFNSLTVDGVKKNDNFGLNRNGYPTQRMPFPFDAVQNVSLELSPFDVQYGGFTACNINAVTRSGTNEFRGRAWASYGDSDLQGDKLEGDSIPVGDFDETRYGFSVGGPIIEDKLFFFAAYEKADGADTFDRCAADESCGRPVAGVTRAQLDRIAQIARDQYGYDPGSTNVAGLANEDEKILIRLDWNINEDHNAMLTYNFNDGFNNTASDNDSDEFEFSNHFYERGTELNAWSGQLFSSWTDNFSTELRVGYSETDPRVQTLNSQGFGEVQIETYADADGDGNFSRAIVYLGGDDSRQTNDLLYDTFNLKLAGSWTAGNHTISGGFETEDIEIFNVFVQHSVGGEYRFDEDNSIDPDGVPNSGDEVTFGCSRGGDPDGCIDQFAAFSPDDIYFYNTPSLDANLAAAEFSYATNSLYIQDEIIFPNADLTIVAGLRYDWYDSSDLPRENPNFEARTGFSNAQNFDGESLLQPRFGFNWDASDTLSVRGGIGLFSGGNPNVWLSNNYSNDGFSVIQAREFNGGVAGLNTDPNSSLATIPLGLDGNGRPIFDAPQSMIQFIQSGTSNGGVNGIDPDFEIPSNWKYSLGATWQFDAGRFGDGYVLNADMIHTRADNSAIIRDDTYIQYSTAPDGRPIYFQGDRSVPGCATDPVGTGFATCGRRFTSDFILDNVVGDDAEATSISATLSKDHDNGLSWTLGYAWSESKDVSPMTSSVAFSNFILNNVSDPNNPGLATSNYETPQRYILRVNYEKEFFGDNRTRFTLFGSHNEGRPYSFTFFEQAMFVRQDFFFGDDDRHLLYMPTGLADPNVRFDPGFDQSAFFAYAEENGLTAYAGGIVPRNIAHADWWTKFDLRISQELPGFNDDHRASVWMNIENLGNLLNDDWGVLYERSFPRQAAIVSASLDDPNNTPNDLSDDVYVFEEFTPEGQSRSTRASLWSIRFGFTYNF